MQVIKPTPSQAAFVLKNFMKELGVDLQLAKAQEAVARLNGYTNWNSLASSVDPRVGEPAGLLQKVDEQTYELRGESQTTVFVNVKNIQVSIKHEDEGVVVDVFSKEGVQHGEESLGSTWVTFDEAEYAPEEEGQENPYRYEAGDKVFVIPEQRLATVLNTYGNATSGAGGEMRLDLCGNTSVDNFEPYDVTRHSAFDHTFLPIRKEWKEDYGITQDIPLRDE